MERCLAASSVFKLLFSTYRTGRQELKVDLSIRVALDQIDEPVQRIAHRLRIDRDAGRCVLDLHGTKRLLGRDRVVLRHLEPELLAWTDIQPCEAARIELIR